MEVAKVGNSAIKIKWLMLLIKIALQFKTIKKLMLRTIKNYP